MSSSALRVLPVDLSDAEQAAAWLDLLDHYARDPMGGGEPLSAFARGHLVERLRGQAGFHGALAWHDGSAVPVGLINCFTGFSTFAAQPLLNIHDLVVRAETRGQGVGQALLDWAAQRALALGCCKLTLEVLANNAVALRAYARAGFAPYSLDPAAGPAVFLQKKLAAERPVLV